MAMTELERVLIAQVQQAERETEKLVNDASSVLCDIVRQINIADNASDGELTTRYPAVGEVRNVARNYISVIGGRCAL